MASLEGLAAKAINGGGMMVFPRCLKKNLRK
jgi:hypothetical protein